MTLTFELRRSYGHDRYYPVNSVALKVCEIAGRVALQKHEIEAFKDLGFTVEIIDAVTAVRKVV